MLEDFYGNLWQASCGRAMANDPNDLERLMVRSLDKELGEGEQLELDRRLIRDPQARRAKEELERIDELAAAALSDAIGGGAVPVDPALLPARTEPTTTAGPHRGWWLVPGAIAAGLLALVLARAPYESSPDSPAVAQNESQVPRHVVPLHSATAGPAAEGLMRTVGTGGQRIRRNTGREVFGVVGDDGNIYWIEVDRIQTIRRPAAVGKGRSARDEM